MLDTDVMVSRLDDWAHRVHEVVMEQELAHIPYAVQAMACVYRLARVVKNPESVLTLAQAHALLDKYIEKGVVQ